MPSQQPEQTSEKPYKSLCSDLYVDASNYLAELVCRKKQESENTGALPIKFWNHPKFKNLYIREVSQAKNLLKIYSELAIINAIQSPQARYIKSLRNKKLIPIIEKETLLIKEKQFVEESSSEANKPRQSNLGKKNILGML